MTKLRYQRAHAKITQGEGLHLPNVYSKALTKMIIPPMRLKVTNALEESLVFYNNKIMF